MSCCEKKETCNKATSTDLEVGDTRRIVRTANDYQAGKNDDTIQITGNETGNATVLVTFPQNPDNGQEITIAASGAPATVASDDDTVEGTALVPVLTANTFHFVAADDKCDPGQWLPECCTEPEPQPQ